MASNDHWPPVNSPACGKSQNKRRSNVKNKKNHRKKVLDLVTEMFATSLEQEVIVSLAQNCNWELQSTIDALIALSATVESPMNATLDEDLRIETNASWTKQHQHQSTDDGLSNEYLMMDRTELQHQVDRFTRFEQLNKKKMKNRMDSFKGNITKLNSFDGHAQTNIAKKKSISNTIWDSLIHSNEESPTINSQNNEDSRPKNSSVHCSRNRLDKITNATQSSDCNNRQSITPSLTIPISTHNLNPFNHGQTSTFSAEYPFNAKKLNNTRQLCGLQVHYRSPGMESSSDDDYADVVIEQEFNDHSVLTKTSMNAPQYLSSPAHMSSPTHQSCCNATLRGIIAAINRDVKILIILRGLPGAGKSTLARKIISMTGCEGDPLNYVFSSDDYFQTENQGLYVYDSNKLCDAHSTNQRRVFNALKSSTSPVIVDNTNLQAWEMRPYASMAVKCGYCIEILDVDTPWANDINVLARKNTHGVLKNKIAEMQVRYEHGIDAHTLLERYSLKYSTDESSRTIKKNEGEYVSIAQHIGIQQEMRQVPDAIQHTEMKYGNIVETDDHVGETPVHDLRKSVNQKVAEGNEQREAYKEFSQLGNVSGRRVTNNHPSQQLCSIGYQSENGLVGSDSTGSVVLAELDTDHMKNRNVSSQYRASQFSLNSRMHHSNNHRNDYFCILSGSSINTGGIRNQDEKSDRETQFVMINSSLLTKSSMNLPQMNDKYFDINNVIDFLGRKSIIEIIEITRDISYCEDVLKNENLRDPPRVHNYRNDTGLAVDDYYENNDDNYGNKSFGNIQNVLTVSDSKMSDRIANCLRMLVSNYCKFGVIGGIAEVEDTGNLDASNDKQITILIVNKDDEFSLTKYLLETFPKVIRTSIQDSDAFVIQHASRNNNKETHTSDISIQTSEKTTDEIYHQTNILYTSDAIGSKQGSKHDPRTIHRFILNGDVNIIRSNEDKHEKSDIVDDSLILKKCSHSYKELNNVDRITWEESPFPIDDINITEFNLEHDNRLKVVSMVDASTNTTYRDFNVAYIGTLEPGYRIIDTYSRHIHEGDPVMNVERPPFKLMLDKSSMTDDLFNNEVTTDYKNDEDNDNCITKLIELFPNIPQDDLTEVYEKLCMKDFDWTVEMLLDGVPDSIITKNCDEIDLDDSEIVDDLHEPKKPSDIICKARGVEDFFTTHNVSHVEGIEIQNNSHRSFQHLQYQVEERGIAPDEEGSNSEDIIDRTSENIRDNITMQSGVLGHRQDSSDIMENNHHEETMVLNLGCELIRTLENEFGHPDFQIPDGCQPIISIKKSIAAQLYALWIESMYQQLNVHHEQLDQMIARDAEFAKSLERESEITGARGSDNNHSKHMVPNLDEIMDMELALAYHKRELRSIVDHQIPDDMAARLSRQMLYESLPDIDPETFNNILKAHNGNFKETFDIIESNTGRSITPCDTVDKSTDSKPSMSKRVDNIYTNTNINSAESSSSIVIEQSDNRCDEDKSLYENASMEAEDLRQEAQRQFSLRVDNFNKAAEAYRRGYPQVAAYYSNVARIHKQNIEIAQNAAVDALVNNQIFGNNENTLDLHYLSVAEALQALDKFLDYHINKFGRCNRKKSSTVYIITGRGARSNNRTSKIKPAVAKRLSSRNIRYIEENPGCLRVNLHWKKWPPD